MQQTNKRRIKADVLTPQWLFLVFIISMLCQHSASVAKSEPDEGALDSLSVNMIVQNALKTFNTPGMSIAVIQHDKVLHLSGYGVANVQTEQAVDQKTYFRLASTSKAFTAASVAMLVDTEQLDWNDRVIDHLPHFRLSDPYATREITIRDLLSHRSGLGSGMGDSMLWPEPAGFSRAEIVHNLRYLTPQFSFRSRYAYSNVMYITAAEIVASKVGLSWDKFIDSTIFQSLAMDCYAGDIPRPKLNNIAIPYAYHDDRGIYSVARNGISPKGLASAAAGGIVCNAEGMSNWLQHLISVYDLGKLPEMQHSRSQANPQPDTFPLFTPSQLHQMWTAQTVLNVSRLEDEWDDTVLKSYGLGWRIANFYGHKFVSHTGTLSGFQAYVGLLPDLGVGIAILNNGSNYGARSAVMQTLLRQFVPEAERKDWVKEYSLYQLGREQDYLARCKEPQGSGEVVLDPAAYIGRFKDQWFGYFDIKLDNDSLRIQSRKMPMLLGTLRPFQLNSWVIEWDNQNAANDAFIHFNVDVNNQVSSFKMHPYVISERENHAWRDMTFYKQ